MQVAKLERELSAARAGKRDQTGYNRGPQGSGFTPGAAGGNKRFNQMSGEEKRKLTCKDYNSSRGCARTEVNGWCVAGAVRLKHGCSKLDGNHICWRDHPAINHV